VIVVSYVHVPVLLMASLCAETYSEHHILGCHQRIGDDTVRCEETTVERLGPCALFLCVCVTAVAAQKQMAPARGNAALQNRLALLEQQLLMMMMCVCVTAVAAQKQMAPARGNAALQNRLALLEQQLAHAQELTAAKDGELAALRVALGQARQLAVSTRGQVGMPDVGPGEHAKKHARLADDGRSPLADDQILDTVFSYVGIGDYIYTGAVSRRWNGRYT
jgi:hypothetical protein